MAKILQLFKGGAVPVSDAAVARREEAERVRRLLLDREHTSEMFGYMVGDRANPDELMATPDEVASKWGNGDYRIYDDMRRNVLHYGALQEGVADVVTSLPMTWLPGVPGDEDSELAAEEVASAWQNIEENSIAIRSWCQGFETGFAPVENVFGVHTRGKARDLIAPVALINRPVSWFGFDYLHRPHFKPDYLSNGSLRVAQFKVSFLRYGSLHTPHGKGTGQFCYPTVWTIDALLKGHLAMLERFGYLPAVVTYPAKRKDVDRLRAELEAQWKNILLMPGDVDDVKIDFPSTNAAYAAANATGQARMLAITKLESWLAAFVQGSMYSAGGSSVGSYARDAVADSARMWKAPSYASCVEATLNRGFIKPIMLANRPNMDESKWPRCVIDSAPGEDIDMLIKIFESGSKMKVRIAQTTWSERFKIPIVPEEETDVAVLGSGEPEPQPTPERTRITDARSNLPGEQSVITVKGKDGKKFEYFSDDLVFVEGQGPTPAKRLAAGDVIVEIPENAVA